MANRNTVGFGLIAQGTVGSTDANQGQGKYYIESIWPLLSIKVHLFNQKQGTL